MKNGKKLKALAESMLQSPPPTTGTPEFDGFWRPAFIEIAKSFQKKNDVLTHEQFDELMTRAELSQDLYQKSFPWLLPLVLTILLGGESASFSAFLSSTVWGDVVTPEILKWVIVLGVILLGLTSYKFIKSAAIEIRVAQQKSRVKQWLTSGDQKLIDKAQSSIDMMGSYYASPFEKNKVTARVILAIFLSVFFLGTGLVRGVDIRANDIANTQEFSGSVVAHTHSFDANEVSLPTDSDGADTTTNDSSTPTETSNNVASYNPVFVSMLLALLILGSAVLALFDMVHRIKLSLNEAEWKIVTRHRNHSIYTNHIKADLSRRHNAFTDEVAEFQRVVNDCIAQVNATRLGKYPAVRVINPLDFIPE